MASGKAALVVGGLVVGGVALMAFAGTARARSKSAGTRPSGARPLYSPGDKYYRIQEGDTLSGLAARATGDASRWRELLPINPSIERHPTWGLKVFAGDVIEVPADWNVVEA